MAPLYSQIERDIVDQIARGDLAPDQPIPTELELCQIYGVSRITVRRAVERLVSARMIYRRRGVGTFVRATESPARSLRLTGYIRDVLTFDQQLTATVLKRGLLRPPPHVLAAFAVGATEQLYGISAINYLNREPYAVTHTWFARSLATVAPRIDLRDGKTSLRHIEELTDIRIRSADQTIEPAVARGRLATQLGLKSNTPVLVALRRYFADGSQPVEVVEVFYHPTRYRLHVDLVGADSFAPPR
jgi:GntR family transcriptional regulator